MPIKYPVIAAKFLNKLGLIKALNLSYAISLNGKVFSIPVIRKLGYQNLLLTEPWMVKTLINLKPLFKGHFVDVGVNVGQTLLKAHAVYDSFNYIGFEPNSSCVHYVEELVAANGLKKTQIIPVGINDRSEVLKLNFFYSDGSDPSASIIEDFRPGEPVNHFRYVPVFDSSALESFLPDVQHPILKIDVEGAELEVLKGMLPWIQRTRPLVLAEILPVYRADNHFRLKRQTELEELSASINYRIGRIGKSDKVNLQLIDSIGIHGDLENCDYLLFPGELKDPVSECFK